LSTTEARQRALELERKLERKRRKRLEKPLLWVLRRAELNRLFVHRHGGHVLPDDDAGREDAFIMAHHLAQDPHPLARTRVYSWLEQAAPWQTEAELEELIDHAMSRKLKWTADRLAKRLNVTTAQREKLRLRTIGAADMSKAERTAQQRKRKQERDRERRRAERRAQGTKPRAAYEATSTSRTRPWVALNISRRTWYRRRGTSATELCHGAFGACAQTQRLRPNPQPWLLSLGGLPNGSPNRKPHSGCLRRVGDAR
jgi:hypothetical protein